MTVRADQLPPRIFGAGTTAEGGRRNISALDGIRGIAVLTVMFSHFARFLPASMSGVNAVLSYGWIGVDLFFVLSGFLITGILLQTKSAINYFRSFYARRFLRIFPIYYATLVVVLAAAAIVPSIPNVPPMNQRWLYFTYLDNWIPVWTHAWPPNVIGHFWSLGVEEQFYLVWPVCVLALSRRRLAVLASVLCVTALVVRCAWLAAGGPIDAVILSTVTRMDALLFGALAALLYSAKHAPSLRTLVTLTIATLTAWLVVVIALHVRTGTEPLGFIATAGYTLTGLGFAAFVLFIAQTDRSGSRTQRALSHPLLRRIGKYSYGMYVYHVPLLGGCEIVLWRHLPQSLQANPLVATAYIVGLAVATFFVAMLSYECFERRLLALKEHAEPVFPADATPAAL